MRKLNKKTILLFALWAVFLVGSAYFLIVTDLITLFTDKQRLIAFVERHHDQAVVIFIVLQTLQVIAAPVPGEITGFVGGLLFGPVWGIVYSTIGLTLGSWLAFMLARWMGRPLVEALMNPRTMKRYDYVMKHKGLFLAFLLFLIPGFPKDYLCYVLGLGHMRVRDFLAVCVIGRLLGTTLLTLGGTYFRDERWRELFVVIGISIAIMLLTMIYRRRIEQFMRRLRATQRLKDMIARRRARARARTR
ncbi:MAG TPA: VTT domain-containing protein [Burkholderiales bacterium]|nr:VTT domain-containing protein [Burkholderiales bacterium]